MTSRDEDLELQVQDDLELVEELLAASTAHSHGLLNEMTTHLAEAGGKRLRPMLTLIASRLGDEGAPATEATLKAATVVELTHLASLYHDDVMDSAVSRRNVDAAQVVWGNNRAILAGDLLFARAAKLVADLGQESVAHHAVTFERLCAGQLAETFGPQGDQDPVEFYLQVLADKTGSLVATSAYLGALHGGADPAIAHSMKDFGEYIGVAFQLADDVLDITSPGTVSGKTPGTDLREGVDTMPVLLLRAKEKDGTLDEAGKRILLLLEGDLQDDENLETVVALLANHPVIDETRGLSREWANKALNQLEGLPDGEARAALEAFALLMVDRAT